jgi:hypothetical protein
MLAQRLSPGLFGQSCEVRLLHGCLPLSPRADWIRIARPSPDQGSLEFFLAFSDQSENEEGPRIGGPSDILFQRYQRIAHALLRLPDPYRYRILLDDPLVYPLFMRAFQVYDRSSLERRGTLWMASSDEIDRGPELLWNTHRPLPLRSLYSAKLFVFPKCLTEEEGAIGDLKSISSPALSSYEDTSNSESAALIFGDSEFLWGSLRSPDESGEIYFQYDAQLEETMEENEEKKHFIRAELCLGECQISLEDLLQLRQGSELRISLSRSQEVILRVFGKPWARTQASFSKDGLQLRVNKELLFDEKDDSLGNFLKNSPRDQ